MGNRQWRSDEPNLYKCILCSQPTRWSRSTEPEDDVDPRSTAQIERQRCRSSSSRSSSPLILLFVPFNRLIRRGRHVPTTKRCDVTRMMNHDINSDWLASTSRRREVQRLCVLLGVDATTQSFLLLVVGFNDRVKSFAGHHGMYVNMHKRPVCCKWLVCRY